MISIEGGGPHQHPGGYGGALGLGSGAFTSGPLGFFNHFSSINPSDAIKKAMEIKDRVGGVVGDQLSNVVGAVQTVAQQGQQSEVLNAIGNGMKYGATYAKDAANGGISHMTGVIETGATYAKDAANGGISHMNGAIETGAKYAKDIAQNGVKPPGVGMLGGMFKRITHAAANGLEKTADKLDEAANKLTGNDDAQHDHDHSTEHSTENPEVDQNALAAEKKAAKRAAKIERRKERREMNNGFAPDLCELHEKVESHEQHSQPESERKLTKAEKKAAKRARTDFIKYAFNAAAHGLEKVADGSDHAGDHLHSGNDAHHGQSHSLQHPNQPSGADAHAAEHGHSEVDQNALAAEQRKAAKRAAKIERRRGRREMNNNGFAPDLFDLHNKVEAQPKSAQMLSKAALKAVRRMRKGREKAHRINGFAPDFELHAKTEAHDHDHQQPHHLPGTPTLEPAQIGHNQMSPQPQHMIHSDVFGNPMMQGNGAPGHGSFLQFNPSQMIPQPYSNHGQFQVHEVGGFNPSMQVHVPGGFGQPQPEYGHMGSQQSEINHGFAVDQHQSYPMGTQGHGPPAPLSFEMQRQLMAQAQMHSPDDHNSMGYPGMPGGFHSMTQGHGPPSPISFEMQRQLMAQAQAQMHSHDNNQNLMGYPGMPGGFNSNTQGHGSPAPFPFETQREVMAQGQMGHHIMPSGIDSMTQGHGSPAPNTFGTQPDPQGPHEPIDPQILQIIQAAHQATKIHKAVGDLVNERRNAILTEMAHNAVKAHEQAVELVNTQHQQVLNAMDHEHGKIMNIRDNAIAKLQQQALRNRRN